MEIPICSGMIRTEYTDSARATPEKNSTQMKAFGKDYSLDGSTLN